METVSVERLCNLLARSKLVPADEVRLLRHRWLREAGLSAADPTEFCKWLVTGRHLTDYQAALLLRGRADHFFLNDYKLLERIGVGGMAGVYKAVHRLGQTVAIKVLPPSKARDAKKFARFQREARLAMRLQHPNIVRTFQIAEDDGLHYLVMEYLEGETLEETIERRGKLPPAEAVRLVHQALLGLQCLHEESMVHRDLKPGNLMLASSRGATTLDATVKILDIGLGRALFDEADVAAGDDANLTADGAIFGTPDYMSPEQARDTHSVDIRSDIYSLGCTLFYALAGQPPFPDKNLVGKMIRHATAPVPSVKTFNPAVPDDLQQIVNRMLAKDAAQRYPTPERVAQALQVFLVADDLAPRETSAVQSDFLEWLRESTRNTETLPTLIIPAVTVVEPSAYSIPVAVPVASPVAASVPEEKVRKKSPLERLSRRDAIWLILGAGILVATAAVVWAIKRLLGKRKKLEESQEEEKNDEAPR
jgi:serine/threonine protein kinase